MDIPFEKRMSSDKPHADLAKDPESDTYVTHFVDTLDTGPESDIYITSITDTLNTELDYSDQGSTSSSDISKSLPMLLTQGSPVHPLQMHDTSAPDLGLFDSNEVFQNWLDGTGASVLHVHGTSGVCEISEHIFRHLQAHRDGSQARSSTQAILYFAFDRYDMRFNSLQAMLSTFLAQLITHSSAYSTFELALDLKRIGLYRSWNSKDLYSLLENLELEMMETSLTYVISGLDQSIDDYDWFLKEIASVSRCSERRSRFAITNNSSAKTQSALFECASINLDDLPKFSGQASMDVALNVESELLTLMQERPEYYEVKASLENLLAECGSDRQLRHWILGWLKSNRKSNNRTRTERMLKEMSPASPKRILKYILGAIEPERRSWARKLLIWVLCCFRPLTCAELQVAFEMDTDVLSEMCEQFGGMFVLKHNEIYFAHPCTRELLINGSLDDSWFKASDEQESHREISYSCLRYLASPGVQEQIATFCKKQDKLQQTPVFDPGFDLLPYALQKWPSHYNLSGFRVVPHTFLEGREHLNNLSQAHDILSNSVNRPEKGLPLPALPVFASLGLDDLVTWHIEKNAQSRSLRKDASLALIEAARNGHSESMRNLLRIAKPSHSHLRHALIAAASKGNESVLVELVEHVSSTTKEFEWPPDLLCRMAWLGLDKVVRLIVRYGIEINPSDPFDGMSPIHIAIRNKHAEVVKILLEAKASLHPGEQFTSIYHTACQYGQPDIVGLLIKAGIDHEKKDRRNWTPFEVACSFGQYGAVDVILKADANPKSKEQSLNALSLAANGGYTKICGLLLKNTTASSIPHQNWSQIFQSAVLNGNVELVELLLDHEPTDDTEEPDRDTINAALLEATGIGAKDVVFHLLSRKADANYSPVPGTSPLLTAVKTNFVDVVQALIDHGANFNVKAPGERTPLHAAHRSVELSRLLLENGATIDSVADIGTPLYLASRWNQIEVVKLYLGHSPILELEIPISEEAPHFDGMTALTVAADCGNTEIMRLLLEAGANVNHLTTRNNFPLQYYLIRNHPTEDGLRTLLEYNPNLDLKDDDDDVALNCLTSTTPVSLIRLMVNAGAKLEIANNQGYTPLCMAVTKENYDVAKYLLSKKAQTNNIRGHRGGPLHLACLQGSLSLVKLLIENGADVNLADESIAGTPLQSACLGGAKEENTHVIKYLSENPKVHINMDGGGLGYAINSACLECSPEIVSLLIGKGAKTDVEDKMRRKPFHIASFRTLDHIKALDPTPQDLLAADVTGRTPLHYAVVSGQPDLVGFILEHSGCDVDKRDSNNWTPLLWAVRESGKTGWTSDGRTEIIRLLLRKGADVWARGEGLHGDWSPLKLARYYGIEESMETLLVPAMKQKINSDGRKEVWDDKFHDSRKGTKPKTHNFCDCCLLVRSLMADLSGTNELKILFRKCGELGTSAIVVRILISVLSVTSGKIHFMIFLVTTSKTVGLSMNPISRSRLIGITTKMMLNTTRMTTTWTPTTGMNTARKKKTKNKVIAALRAYTLVRSI